MRPVAIIGGGITGLTTAFRLQERGVPVTLYEAKDRVGGVIQSTLQDGYLAEFGPNSILETSPTITQLVRDLGLEQRRLESNPQSNNRFIVKNGKPVLVPGSPVKFFTSPLFSARAKGRLLLEPFLRPAPAEAEESLAEFVLRRLGREFLDYAIDPFVAGVYAGDPSRLSVRQAFPKLHALEQKYGSLIKGQILGAKERKRRGEVSKQRAPKFSFDHGLQVLTDALHARLEPAVRLGTDVARLELSGRTWILTTKAKGNEHREEHSAVLLTAPSYRLAEIPLAGASGPDLSGLAAIEYPPVASLVLGFRRQDVAHPLDGFGMLIPKVEGFQILGTIFSSSLFPGRAPADHVTLTSYIGGMRAPELALRQPDALVELTLHDLRAILGVHGKPTFRHCRLFRRAIPQYEVGYGRFKNLMDQIESTKPGLFLAGHFRDGIALGDCIVAGHNMGQRIADYLSRSGDSTQTNPAPASASASGVLA